MNKPRLMVLATGGKEEGKGGSGFGKLIEEAERSGGNLEADIVGVGSNYEHGGVCGIADARKVPFHLLQKPFDSEAYLACLSEFEAEWTASSGFLKLIKGLDPKRTFNIHPGPLPRFGGAGMYGHFVHEEVLKAFSAGEVFHSAVTMHFVDDVFDHGQVFFQLRVDIQRGDTPETLGARVNKQEHIWQPFITNLVVHQQIRLTDSGKVEVPAWYKQMPFCPLPCV